MAVRERGPSQPRIGAIGTFTAAGVALVCLTLAACGGGSTGDQATDGTSTDDTPNEIPPSQDLVATAIRQTDAATFVLEDPDTAAYLEAVFAAKWGLAAGSRDCAVAALVGSVGTGQPITAYLSGQSGNEAEAQAAQECSGPEDRARSEADQPAPDMDIDSARGALAAFAAGQARAADLSAEEAQCYGTELGNSLTDDQLVALFARRDFESDLELGTVVADCVSSDRLDELAEPIIDAASTATGD